MRHQSNRGCQSGSLNVVSELMEGFSTDRGCQSGLQGSECCVAHAVIKAGTVGLGLLCEWGQSVLPMFGELNEDTE